MDNNFKLYLMAFVLFFAGNILQLDEKSTIYMIFALCSLICLIIKLWNETHTQREIITDIVVVGFALLLYTNSKAMTILMLAAFLVASKNSDGYNHCTVNDTLALGHYVKDHYSVANIIKKDTKMKFLTRHLFLSNSTVKFF